jgi:hypothetical protein
MRKIITLIILSGWLIAGCASSQNSANTSQQDSASLIYTAAALTEEVTTLVPEPLQPETQPAITIDPTLTVTPIPTAPVTVDVDLLNLRSGPGTFFQTLLSLPRGSKISAHGMIPDGSCIKVVTTLETGNPLMGWMLAEYLDLSSLEISLPIEEWPEETTISGKIFDTEGNPINAVRVVASIQTEVNELRGEGTSNRDGDFFIYAPPELSGPFNIEIVAVNCASRISEILSDGSCSVRDYIPVLWKTATSLPQPQPIHFTYEQGVAFLEGKVVYQDGNGASQILLKATRQSDDVESEYVTPQGGAFRLPLGLGTWDVVAIRFLQDGTPLFSEIRVIEIATPGQVVEPLLISYTEIVER